MTASGHFGLSAALPLPVTASGAIDLPLLSRHARWCLDSGCESVTVFGTTGEGPSLGMSAREQILGALIGAGLNPRAQIVGGVAATSVHDAVLQSRLVLDADCRAVLLTPSFYYKGVSDDGLFAWYSRVIEELGPHARDIILYNIPSVTAVPVSVDLVTRLRSGVPRHHHRRQSLLRRFRLHARAARSSSRPCHPYWRRARIGGRDQARRQRNDFRSGNICPKACREIVDTGKDDDRVIRLVLNYCAIRWCRAVKALIAHCTSDKSWLSVRPPLTPVSPPPGRARSPPRSMPSSPNRRSEAGGQRIERRTGWQIRCDTARAGLVEIYAPSPRPGFARRPVRFATRAHPTTPACPSARSVN